VSALAGEHLFLEAVVAVAADALGQLTYLARRLNLDLAIGGESVAELFHFIFNAAKLQLLKERNRDK
jgi:hypothetical protein